jgi:hypothetical protein
MEPIDTAILTALNVLASAGLLLVLDRFLG